MNTTRTGSSFVAGIGLLILLALIAFPGAPLAIYLIGACTFLAGLVGILLGAPPRDRDLK